MFLLCLTSMSCSGGGRRCQISHITCTPTTSMTPPPEIPALPPQSHWPCCLLNLLVSTTRNLLPQHITANRIALATRDSLNILSIVRQMLEDLSFLRTALEMPLHGPSWRGNHVLSPVQFIDNMHSRLLVVPHNVQTDTGFTIILAFLRTTTSSFDFYHAADSCR